MRLLSNVVPYFAYSCPLMPMLARTVYSLPILSHHALNAGLPCAMPLPTIATRRPPGARSFKACSTWSAPMCVFFLSVRCELLNGGFITTTVGRFILPALMSGSRNA